MKSISYDRVRRKFIDVGMPVDRLQKVHGTGLYAASETRSILEALYDDYGGYNVLFWIIII